MQNQVCTKLMHCTTQIVAGLLAFTTQLSVLIQQSTCLYARSQNNNRNHSIGMATWISWYQKRSNITNTYRYTCTHTSSAQCQADTIITGTTHSHCADIHIVNDSIMAGCCYTVNSGQSAGEIETSNGIVVGQYKPHGERCSP